ncbi:MAG: 1,4-dihydroxy-2-naphthoate octaprenyltransferase [Aquaticitalea sp.]
MANIKVWLSAMRLRTLPLSISGIIMGGCFAFYNGSFDWRVFILAILLTIALQILSNLANDYGDGIKGTDNENRVGPERALQSGKISEHNMLDAVRKNILVVVFLTVALIFAAFGTKQYLYGFLFLILGGIAMYSALTYTIGDSAYGYKGLGDFFVFVFFGLVSVIGSYFLFIKHLDHVVILPAIALGLLSVGVLNLNNMRDIESDLLSEKITLAVKLGKNKAKKYHLFLIIGAILVSFIFSILYYTSMWNFLFFIAYIPLVLHIKKILKASHPDDYDSQLKILAVTTFLFSVLLGLGYIL